MKRYVKPSMTVARFMTQETIANNAYGTVVSVDEQTIMVSGNEVVAPVTSFAIDSFGANS